MSELMNGNMEVARTKDVVTFEVKQLFTQARGMAIYYSVEIGCRLCELKEMLDHGEWGNYLSENFQLSQSTANNFMRIFNEYGADQIGLLGSNLKSQTFENLSLSQALYLLAVDESEREEFVKEHDPQGMSSREFKKAVEDATKKADEAESRTKAAEKRAKDAEKNALSMETKWTSLKIEISKKEQQIKELENAALPDPILEIPEEEKQNIRKEAEAAAKDAIEKLNKELDEAYEEKIELEKKLKAAQDKTLLMADVHFNIIQDEYKKILVLIDNLKIENKEKSNQLCLAVNEVLSTLADKAKERVS